MKAHIQRKLNNQFLKLQHSRNGYGIGRIKLIDLKPPDLCRKCKIRLVEIKITEGKYKKVCKNKKCEAYSQSTQTLTIHEKLERNPQINQLLKDIFSDNR